MMELAGGVARVDRYEVALDRRYHRVDHVWVREEAGLLRVGVDALEMEVTGDVAQLILIPPGTEVVAGGEVGSLEAQKFVGSLRSPVSGTVVAVNEALFGNARLLNDDPYGAGWLVLIEPADTAAAEFAGLVGGDDIEPWFAESVAEYRRNGSVAE